jgi:hypothetical protein
VKHRWLVVPAILAVVGCSPNVAAVPLATPEATVAPATSPLAATSVSTASPATTGVEDVPAEPPASCPVTKPVPEFRPPAGYLAKPSFANRAWFGTAKLWTDLDVGGEVWSGLPGSPIGPFGQKTFWWSSGYSGLREPTPMIKVKGRRLDREAPPLQAGDPGTNALFDGMWSMLVGVDVPTAGCWQLTAIYREAELPIVVWIDDD